jgi:hypothetical protein
MTQESPIVICTEDTQTFTIDLPCKLAERIEKYANEMGGTITGVIIEALDVFLRNQKEG